ncbi:NAD(P)/FAD-dependent oxidoreductase [Aquabacter cavernae]|uniref:NAD(P)/FAD-dependent oxidoreductase n=1 Tax=Aquabacter cavernae TaxID=2496029 RepID=UPI000F8E0553|nr:FAD-binding oxidoreductase [Aquabacter cavernae]
MARPDYDFAVIGGGFYGCCLALLLRSISDRVVVVEAGEGLLERASRVNQARIHTGFHYPRSFLTALRSMVLHRRFALDFPEAVVDDFTMLYAIARRRSKVSAARFLRMFEDLGAPIVPAGRQESALFSPELVEAVFNAREWAFDYRALRERLTEQLDRNKVEIRYGAMVDRLEPGPEAVGVSLSNGTNFTAGTVFNVTYAMLNAVLRESGISTLALKHEFVEIALALPPEELKGRAVTVMDGPFFSMMPYPSVNLYSLTHVRYTPHYSWLDGNVTATPYELAERLPRASRWRHMMMDARRYMPCLGGLEWQSSLFDVKTLLLKNERNDGRPILFHRHPDAPNVISVLGGKIDNVYDLFEALPLEDARWRRVDLSCLLPGAAAARIA